MSYETTNYNMTFSTFYIVLTSDSLQMRNCNVILIPIWDVGIAEAITMAMDKSMVSKGSWKDKNIIIIPGRKPRYAFPPINMNGSRLFVSSYGLSTRQPICGSSSVGGGPGGGAYTLRGGASILLFQQSSSDKGSTPLRVFARERPNSSSASRGSITGYLTYKSEDLYLICSAF